jgi:hypothetical protein
LPDFHALIASAIPSHAKPTSCFEGDLQYESSRSPTLIRQIIETPIVQLQIHIRAAKKIQLGVSLMYRMRAAILEFVQDGAEGCAG